MSDGGEIEIENSVVTDALPKDIVKEVGNVKLFNKWDYDVEVRDISLTYVRNREIGQDCNFFRQIIGGSSFVLMD